MLVMSCLLRKQCGTIPILMKLGNIQQTIKVSSIVKQPLRLSSTASNSTNNNEYYDGLPYIDKQKGIMIYSGSLSKKIKTLKLFSFTTSFIGLGMQPFIYLQTSIPLAAKISMSVSSSIFVVLTPLLIHWFAKNYVRVCYFNESGQFSATTYNFFLQTKEHKFTSKDVHRPSVPGMFTTLKVRNVPLFFNEESFINKKGFFHLMGFDIPLLETLKQQEGLLDLEEDEEEEQEEEKQEMNKIKQ